MQNLDQYKNKFVVYLLEFPNGKKYCGYSSNIKRRWHGPSQYKDCFLVYKAIQKYGWHNINKKIICSFEDKQTALKTEAFFIDYYNLLDHSKGYNLIPGGGDPPHNPNLISEQGKLAMKKNGQRLAKQTWSNPEKKAYCIKRMKQGNQQWLKKASQQDRKRRYGERNLRRTPVNAKPIYQLDKNTFKIINEFPSARAAAIALGDSEYNKNIRRTANGTGQTAYGFRWAWKSDYQKGIKIK